MRMIDADALSRIVKLAWDTSDSKDFEKSVFIAIATAPTIEERKKGKWIIHPEVKNIYGGTYIECSECGEKYVVQYVDDEKFCRNCGADMRG